VPKRQLSGKMIVRLLPLAPLRSLMAGAVGAWDNFLSGLAEESQLVEQVQPAPTRIFEDQQQHRPADSADQDALAQTAGKLVEALREEHNPKFKNSQFMGLMRSLADRTSVVEGNDIVSASSVPANVTSTSADVKGKGKERADTIGTLGQTIQVNPSFTKVGVTSGRQFSALSYTQSQTSNGTIMPDVTQDSYDEVYEYFKQENEDYIAYQSDASKVAAENNRGVWDPSSQQYEWDKLQGEWDAWEANAVGVRKMSNYQFASENPYLLGSSTRVHEMHSSFDQVGAPSMRITGSVDSDA
jgi:peroxin-5